MAKPHFPVIVTNVMGRFHDAQPLPLTLRSVIHDVTNHASTLSDFGSVGCLRPSRRLSWPTMARELDTGSLPGKQLQEEGRAQKLVKRAHSGEP